MSLQAAKMTPPVGNTSAPLAPTRRRWGAPLNQPIQNWQGRRVWLVGASSGIGLACAKALHVAGAKVIVSAREVGALSEWAETCKKEGLPVELMSLDVTDALQVKYVARQVATGGSLDFVLYCAGHYRAQRATEFDLKDMLRHQDVNYNGMLRVLDAVLPMFLQQGCGHISLVSSVAGWRGLPNGFVATPLTAQNNFQMPALISPEEAAKAMLAGWSEGLFDIHFPKRFTAWLKLLRLLPYRVYFALVRRFTGL